MSLQQQGKIIEIYPTVQVSEKFKKREFVIEISEQVNGQTYTNPAKFQCVQTRCDALDRHKVGDTVNVHFNIKGNKWEKDGKTNYITNLDAWRVEAAQGTQVDYSQQQGTANAAPPPAPNNNTTPPVDTSDLPF